MKVVTIFGTRPEMIKLWSTIRRLDDIGVEQILVHTGQNFTKELRDFFFEDLELRKPDFELAIDTSSYAAEVADVITKSDSLFERVKPDGLLILGDTYSGLSILPAQNRNITTYHMEAGLRAWDTRMPEQKNRILIDHASQFLLPFDEQHRHNLTREGIHPSKIFVTGNPTFEVMRHFQPRMVASNILTKLDLKARDYILVTAHRAENVDDPVRLQSIFTALGEIHIRFGKEVLYPMHPRTRSKLDGIAIPKGIRITDPLGFYDFGKLIANAGAALSDSGTAAEECLFYKVPYASIRDTTERPETVESGGHIIAGLEPDNIVASLDTAINMGAVGHYPIPEDHHPSAVVANVIRSRFTRYY